MERLHRDIDALAATATHAELAAATQKVLRTMAYYISQSEAAVLEYRESWHGAYSNALYSDAGKSRPGGPASGGSRHQSAAADAAPRSERETGGKGRRGGRGSARGAATGRDGVEEMFEASRASAPARIDAAHRAAAARTTASRPRRDDVPDSLRAILDGSHPSFKGGGAF